MADVDAVTWREAAAANVAAWHDSSVRALHEAAGAEGSRSEGSRSEGSRSEGPRSGAPRQDGRWWWYDAAAPNIYFTAISLRPAAPDHLADAAAFVRHHVEATGGGHACICDSWDELDLRALGLVRRPQGRWSMRPAGSLPAAGPAPELRVERVRDDDALAAFERTVVEGFGARFPVEPFGIHGRGILRDPAMHVFVGYHRDEAVSVAMAYEAAGLLGVYGVATVPSARRRGFATAMTRAALAVAPDHPAVLQPTPAAGPIYERLGFRDVGTFGVWVPSGAGP